MAKNIFSAEDRSILSSIRYTAYVSETTISFTKEFKDLFWERYKDGEKPSDIFKDLGYDTKMLGSDRVYSFKKSLERDFASNTDFHTGRLPGLFPNEPELNDLVKCQKALAIAREELELTRQENAFLKKTISVANSKR